jgi:hypothetical protein
VTVELTDEELQTRLGRVPQDVIDRFAARIRAAAIEEVIAILEDEAPVIGNYRRRVVDRVRALKS